jgi:endothelin-converting enzyme/putative endopeptidase
LRRHVPAALSLALLAAACRTSSPAAVAAAPVPPAAEAGPALKLPPIDLAALDRTVSPCDDFFRFACGGWIASHPIPPDRPRWGRFDELAERNLAELRAILDAAVAGRRDPGDRFSDKLADYYGACMDEAAVERDGLRKLREEWARIDAVKDRDGLAAEIARLQGWGIGVPFTFTSGQDLRDATQVIGWLWQGGLGLPDRDYYLSKDERHAKIRADYAGHVRRMLGLAGVAPAEAEAQAAAVLVLETALAESHWTKVELRDPKRIYNRVDRAGLEKLAPAFPWTRWLADLGHPGVTAVAASTPRFVETVGRLFADAPLPRWKAYLRWHVLAQGAGARALPRAFVDERFAFTSAAFTGAKELEPRWKACVKLADRALGEALGESYVRLHFGDAAKARTVRLVREIEAAMEDDLGRLDWMAPETRARAREKLHLVANKIGFPDRWRDYSALHLTRGDWLGDVLAGSAFEVQRQLAKIGKPLDRGEWMMSPPTVNAYYDASLNEMVFPAGILQPPFWNPAAPEPVNFGGIGMVVGHELTHGFDDEGRKFDGHGNLTDWWTPADRDRFEARAACLVKQYGAYEPVPGARLNGELTLGENIADLGGVKLAGAALRAAGGAAPQVAGFTAEQQFFLGVAQIWCSATREPFARMLAVTDPHSPPRFRVDGTLANTPEFARAFGCREGTAMARPAAERCAVW